MKSFLMFVAAAAFSMSLFAQNWTDPHGTPVGQRSGGSRYYTVDNGTTTQRLAAWLRTHTQQSAGRMTCTGDLFVSLTVLDAANGSYMSHVKRGETVELELNNGNTQSVFAAVAFVDENEQWTLAYPTDGKAFELGPGTKNTVPCTVGQEVATGDGHFVLLAYSKPFNMNEVVEKYQSEFLYERNVKAGAALYMVSVK